MRPQLLGLKNNIFNLLQVKSYRLIHWGLFIAFAIFLSGCKNDLEKISMFDDDINVPNMSIKNMTMLKSDSSKLVMRIWAPEMKNFDNVDEPFIEFPKGLVVTFLDSLQRDNIQITSKYAIYYNRQRLYYAKDSVVVKKIHTDEWVKSEEMYWDEDKRLIYSNKLTWVKSKGKLRYFDKYFESNEDFTVIRAIGLKEPMPGEETQY